MRGEGNGGNVFAAVLSFLDKLGNFIPDTGSKTSIQWSVFGGIPASEEIAGLDEELGDDVQQVVVNVSVEVCFS